MVVLLAIIITQSQLNLSLLSVFTIKESAANHAGTSYGKIGGGTINTENDMRGEQHLILNTDNPTVFIMKTVITSSDGEEIVLEGFMMQKCSYNIEHLLETGLYTATAITNSGWSFSGSFQKK